MSLDFSSRKNKLHLLYNRGTRPDDFDAFHEMILWDEIGRAGGGAVLWQLGVNSMALPPVIDYGSDYLKDLVVRSVRSLVQYYLNPSEYMFVSLTQA